VTALTIEKLTAKHSLSGFDCGVTDLNRHLTAFAFQNQSANAAQTYVCVSGSDIAGFYSLSASSVAFAEAPERMRKGLARHPLPVMLLARLAIDRRWQGKGIGASLLKDASLRAIETSSIAGVRALVVQAKDENALSFYRHFGFLEGFAEPNILYFLTKDLRSKLS
jgi:GNAT superfamily N-acetyltransferase